MTFLCTDSDKKSVLLVRLAAYVQVYYCEFKKENKQILGHKYYECDNNPSEILATTSSNSVTLLSKHNLKLFSVELLVIDEYNKHDAESEKYHKHCKPIPCNQKYTNKYKIQS